MNYPTNSAVSRDEFISALLMTIPNAAASEPAGPTYSWPPYSGYQSPRARPAPGRNDPLKWVSANWEVVNRQFPNQWIVVQKDTVVAHSETVSGLREQINRLGIENPFVTKTGRGSIVWRTAYGRY
jgi:hypothetical protein